MKRANASPFRKYCVFKSTNRIKCLYCDYERAKNLTRFKQHLMKCPGNIPSTLKDRLEKIKNKSPDDNLEEEDDDDDELEASVAAISDESEPQVTTVDHEYVEPAEETVVDVIESTTTVTENNQSHITITINTGAEALNKLSEISPLFLSDIPWYRQVTDPWANNSDVTDGYLKVDNSRKMILVTLVCRGNDLSIEVYDQNLNTENYKDLRVLQKQYLSKQLATIKPILARLDSLKLCRGLIDSRIKEILRRNPRIAQLVQLCNYSNSYRSKKCELLFGDDWSLAYCRDCDEKAKILHLH